MELRRSWFLLVLILVAVTACGGDDVESQLAAQQEQIRELEAQLAEATATSTTTTTPTTTTTTSLVTTTAVETRDVTVTFDLIDDRNWEQTADGCDGRGPYSDITSATQMILEDELSRRVAVASLGPGKAQKAGASGTDYGASFCRFKFTFPNVPVDRSLYTVGNGRRGSITFERTAFLWEVSLHGRYRGL